MYKFWVVVIGIAEFLFSIDSHWCGNVLIGNKRLQAKRKTRWWVKVASTSQKDMVFSLQSTTMKSALISVAEIVPSFFLKDGVSSCKVDKGWLNSYSTEAKIAVSSLGRIN